MDFRPLRADDGSAAAAKKEFKKRPQECALSKQELRSRTSRMASLWGREYGTPLPAADLAGTAAPSSAGSTMANAGATSLRWRARIAKEATAFPFDDSSAVLLEDVGDENDNYGDDELDDKSLRSAASASSSPPSRFFRSVLRCFGAAPGSSSSSPRRCLRRVARRGIRPALVPAIAVAAVASSFCALAVSTHVAVALASALTVAVSAVVAVQQRLLAAGGAVQRSRSARQSQRLRELRTERERLCRQVLQLDAVAERRRDVRRQLAALLVSAEQPSDDAAPAAVSKGKKTPGSSEGVDLSMKPADARDKRPRASPAPPGGGGATGGADDIASAIRVARRYKDAVAKLQREAQHQVLVTIARAALPPPKGKGGSDSLQHPEDFDSFAEPLLAQLREVRGVSFDENLVREYLRDNGAGGGDVGGGGGASNGSTANVAFAEPSLGLSPAISLPGLVGLLRQVISDGEVFAMSAAGVGAGTGAPGTPPRRKRRGWSQQQLQRRKLSTVFSFYPEKLLLMGGTVEGARPDTTASGALS